MVIYLLSTLIFISGISYLFAIRSNSSFWMYLLKPGTMLFMILLASTELKEPNLYVIWMIIGLLFSVCGDIFLMLPKNMFLQGLTSFLIAHLCYIVAFTNGLQHFTLQWGIMLLVGLFGFLYYGFLYSSLKKTSSLPLQIGVLLYIVVICFMFTQSFSTGSPWTILGAFFFLISDAVLAYNQFHKPFQAAHYYVMTTYYLAQYFIVLGLLLK